MNHSPESLADTYFTNWVNRNIDAMGDVLAENATFTGPMGTANGRQECLNGLAGVRSIVDEIRVTHRWVDGNDVITWFEFHVAGIDPIPVVNWSHVENGHIASIRAIFDPRALIAHLGSK